MSRFTSDNWNGSDEQIETANLAYDEAWGAIKGRTQRLGETIDADQVRQSLADAINNAFADGISAAEIAETALKYMGFEPARSAFSLECL